MIQAAGGVVVNPDRMIAVVAQPFGTWSLPKGHVEDGESLYGAAKREIHEETGIPIEQLCYMRPLGTYVRNMMDKEGGEVPDSPREVHWFMYLTDHRDKLIPGDAENPEARWVPIKDVANLLTHPKDKEFFDSIKDSLL